MRSLEEILQKLNVKALNPFQERVLKEYLSSKDNLLLSAPTGIGKTLIAEVMLLLNEKKGVFVSPLRALSLQVYDELSKIDSVKLATGDVYIDDVENMPEHLMMTTYEKFDSIIRHGRDFLKEVDLVIIDEVHNMRDKERSPAIESIIEWALEEGKRLVLMSATVGNIEEIAEWTHAKLLTHDTRPVPLFEYVKFGDTLYDKDGRQIKLKKDLIAEILEKGKNVLIFENTRKRAEVLANELSERYGNTAFFHGGLSLEEKEAILKGVMEGKIRIVVSTTALGQGVNLPIYAVIFRNMTLPVIENGKFLGWKPLTVAEYKQIAGRAGRPRFDREGIAIIEAKSPYEVQKYIRTYLNGKVEDIRGYLNLADFLLAYIVRKTYAKLEEIKRALSLTFSLRDTEEEEIRDTLEMLTRHELIYYNKEDNSYSSTTLGREIAYAYVNVEDAMYYLQFLKDDDQSIDDLVIIANSPKVQNVARGSDIVSILEEWIKGEEVKELTKYGQNITEKDVKNIIETASWQAYTLYRIKMAIRKRYTDTLLLWQSIQNGVPKGALNLVRLKGVGRKLALELYRLGYTKKSEICQDLNNILPKLEPQLQWRVKELCKVREEAQES